MKTLIKTNNSLILVSDEEIKEGDYILTPHQGVIKWEGDNEHLLKEYCKKVLSQSPNLSNLSEEDKKKIGWIDVEETLNAEYCNYCRENPEERVVVKHFKAAFNKAQELNQKKYPESDLRKAFEAARQYKKHDVVGFNSIQTKKKAVFATTNDYIQSLSQPKQYPSEAELINGEWYVTKIN